MPLADLLRREGVVFGPWRGVAAALHFGDWHAEYAALDSAACVLDTGGRTQIEVLGADRIAFLHRMCTNQVAGREPGSGCEAFLLDAKGHVLAYVRILVAEDSLLLETSAGQSDAVLSHLSKYVVRDRVEFHDRSGFWYPLRVAGRQAQAVLQRLLGDGVPDRPLRHARALVAGLEVRFICLWSEGRACWQLLVEGGATDRLWSAVRQLGATPCGRLAAEAFRIERGEPEYGIDITVETLAQEVGRNDMAISTTKGCYLGQEVVARIDSRGHVNRHLEGLVFSTREVPSLPVDVYAEGELAGRITSAAFSPGLGAAVGLGYVRRNYSQPGQRLDCSCGPVEVAALPLRE